MGLVVNGQILEVPHLSVRSWHDDVRLRLRKGEDMRIRANGKPHVIVMHTTGGIPGGSNRTPQVIHEGLGPNSDAESRVARFWSTNRQPGGAHLVVDYDASVGCLADLQTECAFHVGGCRGVNERSVGIEIAQTSKGELWAGQLEAVAYLVGFICDTFGIPKRAQYPYRGKPLKRFGAGVGTFTGIMGHRDCDNNRGSGDPGDAAMLALRDVGIELVDFGGEA
jgi:hypothetical protein